MNNGVKSDVREQTVMEREGAALDEALCKLASVNEVLESKLTILRVSQEEPEPVKTEDKGTMSSVCMQINGWRRHIEGLEIRVSLLINELEI